MALQTAHINRNQSGRHIRGLPSAISIAVIPSDHRSLWNKMTIMQTVQNALHM